LISVPRSFAFQTTVTSGSPPVERRDTITRGGISPFTRASPATALTRTGAANVRPPSRLTASITSALPSAEAPQTTATKDAEAATQGVLIVRLATAKVTVDGGAAPSAKPPHTRSTAVPRPQDP
jgi:hypothetical protein